MNGSRGVASIGATAAAWVLCASYVGAGFSRPELQVPDPKPVMAEDVFKNIQVLRGIPVDQFMGTMGFFSAALGLNCTDCHVDESGGNWAKYADDNALKQMARRMVTMVAAINKTNFGGRQVVTCNTCHRGSSRPNVMPSLVALYASPPPDEPGEPFVQAPGQPRTEQVLEKYLQAAGGAQRVAAITSIAATGTYMGYDDADKSVVEIFGRAPGLRSTIVHTLSGDSTTTYDGRIGWIAAPDTEKPFPLISVTGQDLDGMRLEASLMFPGQIAQALKNWRVGARTIIDDREVQPVQGTTERGGTATLCFDAQTGLLVRLVRFSDSPVGRIVTQVDYSDYREVSGVKMPFKWTVTWLGGRSKFELTDVKANVPVDASRFTSERRVR